MEFYICDRELTMKKAKECLEVMVKTSDIPEEFNETLKNLKAIQKEKLEYEKLYEKIERLRKTFEIKKLNCIFSKLSDSNKFFIYNLGKYLSNVPEKI